jgi:hypothetical protein
MQFVFESVDAVDAQTVSTFWLSYFIALAIWLIIGKALADHAQQLKAFLKTNYPQSRPFEYLFFIFLFISTGCLALLATTDNITRLLLENVLYTFALVFFYAGAIMLGWFHYMKRIEG